MPKSISPNPNLRTTLWKLALLYTGNETLSEKFVGNAYAASCRAGNSPDAFEAAAKQLLHAFKSQADDPNPSDIAENSPLLELFRLSDSQRILCALQLCGLTDAQMSDILDCTLSELKQKQVKMNRSLRFSEDATVSMESLQTAADALTISEDAIHRIDAVFEKKMSEKADPTRKIELRQGGTVQEIVRTEETVQPGDPKPIHTNAKTIRLPIWGLVLCITLPMMAAGITTGLLFSRGRAHTPRESSVPSVNSMVHISTTPTGEIVIDSPYLDFAQAREKALLYAEIQSADATFIKTKLIPESTPVSYELTFLDKKGTQYDYFIDAESGALIDYNTLQTNTVVNTKEFLPLDKVRSIALESAGLTDAIFTKEKLANESDVYYYKIEFNDTTGKSYTVQLLATTGELLKYSVKEANSPVIENAISMESAKQQALLRAGILNESQVTFTKEKLDGSVYLLAFTIEDGTQYTIELDAQSGLANTVDVILVSADTKDFIGFTKAKAIALQKAGLNDAVPIVYTKAKIDRDNAAYVYELEFETEDYSYEVRLNTRTGEVLKYRAWFR